MCSVFLPYFKLIAINIDSDKWHICCFTCMNMHIYIYKATKYSKYPVSSSILGMPREAKVPIPHSMWVEDLIYIYMFTPYFSML